MSTFQIGCDPEFFVSKDGKPYAAIDLVPGNKEAPYKVDSGAVQVDGLALEINTNPVPSDDFKAFNEAILKVLKTTHAMVKAKDPTLAFNIVPSVEFEKGYYDSLPESAKELGCDPDFCAYSEDPFEANPRPDGDSGLRGAGGHIHIGWGADIPLDHPDHIEICRQFIRNLDIYVGLGMTIIDTDEKRRQVYGKAGAYRPKSYGVEYRTPSNAWLVSEGTRRFIHRLVTAALDDMMKGEGSQQNMKPKKRIDAQAIINEGDAELAYRMLTDRLGIRVPKELAEANPKLAGLLALQAA